MADWSIQPTADGSVTFFSHIFQEAFHSHTGAYQEALGKFVYPSGLLKRAGPIRLLDICYGLGYNSAALLECLWQERPGVKVEVIALDLDPTVAQVAKNLGWLASWSLAAEPLGQLATDLQVTTEGLEAVFWAGDARETIQRVPLGWADGIFLDPFSPARCPMLWTAEFLALVAQRLHPEGRLVTYSAAAAVRQGLRLAGLTVRSTPPVGRRSPGTIAAFGAEDGWGIPLSTQEQEHLCTKAAVPYRDPTLQADTETIHRERRLVQETSDLASGSAWRRRWLVRP
ncbi:tRNA (5-methylaminomethyl-2-thiouridine)(34)-methyltransferase MnmD [Anthocerotibacter panamensis]|uniref:tRNA (5-methylaminomethyl-2-thiouridine)(34)-methyltransferase MnmD n=1 Tax=Anthocerotibacter panamensis TaxID=2857077 RepID=UPI001C406263|nr:MnmC family methyltransferase [Anthocerotibacter panamensis]